MASNKTLLSQIRKNPFVQQAEAEERAQMLGSNIAIKRPTEGILSQTIGKALNQIRMQKDIDIQKERLGLSKKRSLLDKEQREFQKGQERIATGITMADVGFRTVDAFQRQKQTDDILNFLNKKQQQGFSSEQDKLEWNFIKMLIGG